MFSPGSVTLWIDQLKAGERDAAQPLWQNYFRHLVSRARRKLIAVPRRAADEEDVALSTFDSFCRAAHQGRFPDLNDRDDLWQLLALSADGKRLFSGSWDQTIKVWDVSKGQWPLPVPCSGPLTPGRSS